MVWLLSFSISNKDAVVSVSSFAELTSKLVLCTASGFLAVVALWQRKRHKGASRPTATVDRPQAGRDVVIQQVAAAPFNPLHQLPPPPADFTGREEELKDLLAAIAAGGATIAGVRGQGGIGKTVLALKLAEKLTPNFPDAQIYLNLLGISEKPLTPGEAMAYVIRAFHPEAKLPEKEDELGGIYRSVLNGKRVLLLMDNAKDAAQVKPLVPPAGCAVLVTSRVHFALPGLYAKDLETLPPAKAEELLLRISQRRRLRGSAAICLRPLGWQRRRSPSE
jgi:hypothetical protein